MTLYLFWDIDGTLLTTARAGIFAFEEACQDVLGAEIDLRDLHTAGMTDFEIAMALTGSRGRADAATATALLERYEHHLPERLAWRRGEVLPNVRENLEALAERDDVVNMLLTGNVAGGAEAKLRHYDLWSFFGAGGAFSVGGANRSGIASRARELAAEHGGEVPPGERMVVIGDTPRDVACGKAIGARTVALATGPSYGVEELRATEPWLLLDRLPKPSHLRDLLGLAPNASS